MIDFLRNSEEHIFVDSLDDVLSIMGDDFHHMVRVKRIRESGKVSAACDGSVRSYEVRSASKTSVELRATGEPVTIDEPRIELALSLFKIDKLEEAISMAVQAGATSITVGATQRSSIRLDSARKDKALKRISSIVRASAMQSRRAQLIPVRFVDNLFTHLENTDLPVVFADPDGQPDAPSAPVVIVIGPEGGFDTSERESISSHAQLWSISPYILRAETAAGVAVSAVARK